MKGVKGGIQVTDRTKGRGCSKRINLRKNLEEEREEMGISTLLWQSLHSGGTEIIANQRGRRGKLQWLYRRYAHDTRRKDVDSSPGLRELQEIKSEGKGNA